MPSWEHELPLDLIRFAPELAAQLYRCASGKPLPPYARARCEAGEATTTAPAELLSDSVVVLEDGAGVDEAATSSLLAIVVEVQSHRDNRKLYSWPAYVANVRHRLRCPVLLLVLTPDQALAYRYREPIDLGCGEVRPVVLPLSELPLVTDSAAARGEPELAVLSAAVQHTADRAALAVLPAALDALDTDDRALYADYVFAALPVAARKYLEEILATSTYEWKSDFARRYAAAGKQEGLQEGLQEGRQEGRQEASARALLTVLEGRGFEISASVRQRVTECADLEQVDLWLRRAATADRVEQVFN